MPKKTCYQYSLDLLARRDYSKHKLSEKLRSREFTEEEIDEAIESLTEKNYLREEEYARMRVQAMLFKGYANSYIKQKCSLEKLQVDDDFIDEIRQERGHSTHSEIKRLIQKKLRGKDIPSEFEPRMKLQNKVTAFLASRGYNYSQIKEALTEHFKAL